MATPIKTSIPTPTPRAARDPRSCHVYRCIMCSATGVKGREAGNCVAMLESRTKGRAGHPGGVAVEVSDSERESS